LIIYQNYEINNIKDHNIIDKPDKTLINESLLNASINDYINIHTNYKENLNKNDFIQIEIYPDGNCYYRCLSKFFNNSESYHIYFRNVIYNYIIDKILFWTIIYF
jgi:hypothetical protein